MASHIIDKTYEKKVSKNRKKEHTKKAEVQSIKNAIKLQRWEKGRGIIINNNDDDQAAAAIDGDQNSDEDFTHIDIFKPVPPNVCNLCGRVFNSTNAKKTHVNDNSGKHGERYRFECKQEKCGCVYDSPSDLMKHSYVKHDRVD